MRIVHLTSSRFFGGPERQMLGLALALRPGIETSFLSFSEGGRCRDFMGRLVKKGFEARELRRDTPRLVGAAQEITQLLGEMGADLLFCHGYKADLIGYRAARRCGIPVVAVSRGWTSEDIKVWLYESLDRRLLKRMDTVVCVSAGQARQVRAVGVPDHRIRIIRNAARVDAFPPPSQSGREKLLSMLPRPGAHVAVAAARLSPEKGIAVLVDAARAVCVLDPQARFIVFGDGPLRAELTRRITAAGLNETFVLTGFRPDLDELIPNADVMVLPSFNEGLPNVVLEAFAAGVPVVATAVGGTPEVVRHGENGFLVKAGDTQALAVRVAELFARPERREAMGRAGRALVHDQFTFAAQARQYRELFLNLPAPNRAVRRAA